METKAEINNYVVEGNHLDKPKKLKKIKNTQKIINYVI